MSNLSEAQKEILTIEYFYPQTSTTTVGVYMNTGQREPEDVKKVVEKFMEIHESFRMKLRRKGAEVERYYVNESAPVLIEHGEAAEIKQQLEEKSGLSYFNWDDYLYEMSVHVASNGDVYTSFFGHHMIVDGVGMYLYIDAMHDLLKTGDCARPQLTLDQCVEEEQAYSASERSEKSRTFWQNKVAGYDGAALVDMRKIDASSLQTKNHVAVLDETFTRDLSAYCDANHVSLTQLISGAVLLYKAKMTNNASVAVNSTIHGRSNRRKRGVLSTFARALPLIVDINEELTVLEYLEMVKSEMSGLMRNYKISHYDLMACTKNTSGLDDLSVSVQTDGRFKEKYMPTLIEGAWLMPKESMRPLTLHIKEEQFSYEKDVEIGEGFQLSYEFLSTVYDEETVANMHEKLTHILTQMVSSTDRLVQDIDILSESEKTMILTQFNDTACPYPKDKTIVEVFEDQVLNNPNGTAVIYNDINLTYQELNEKANRLAHYLIENYDIKPEDKVGLLLERNDQMIVSILGVLKAGAAYVPISPEYPEERITYITEVAELKTTLVESADVSSLASPLILSELALEGYKNTNPCVSLTPSSLAYIIFTSGTTGKPKGVMIEHHQVNNFIGARRKACRFEEKATETIVFSSNYVFDASVDHIYSALLYGDRLLVVPNQLWTEPTKFAAYLSENNATYIQMTPSLLQQLNLAAIPSLKYVMAGGESVTSQLLEKVQKLNFVFVNGYGPTEATVATNLYVYEGNEERNIIGYPLQNTTNYVLDHARRPVPQGTIGELYIGGVQISRGYVNQPELTAERFIPNPFQTSEQKKAGWNERIYQTGDLVRMLPDGALEYHGRSDFQVKIRGYRIELGEIENALLTLPEITGVHVMALGEIGNKYLGAYYTAEEALAPEVLNAELAKKLPEYMMPAGYQQLKEFPLTVNGKLDHRALPEIGFSGDAEYVAPSTELEKIVAATYEEILEIDQVGTNDDFFRLGGHSLRALRLVNLLEERTGKQVQVKHIFETPSVRQLASSLETMAASVYERI
ncbi:MAG: amino acid adenylation domain-containing protein, partial [Turicibacter sp.]|nr:amino acid adenylation domain-containing protein [Turicibacter sp.]